MHECVRACLHRECSFRVRKEKTKIVFNVVDENRSDSGVVGGAQRGTEMSFLFLSNKEEKGQFVSIPIYRSSDESRRNSDRIIKRKGIARENGHYHTKIRGMCISFGATSSL